VANTATISGGGESGSYASDGNNSSTATITTVSPAIDLAVTGVQPQPQQTFTNSTLSFSVNAANLGPQPATKAGGVTVKNVVSLNSTKGLIYDGTTSGGTNGWTCDTTMTDNGDGTGTVNCSGAFVNGTLTGMGANVPNANPPSTTVLTLKFFVGSQIAQNTVITLTSTIDPSNVYPEDTNQANNTAVGNATVLGGCTTTCPDLSANLTVDQATATLHFSTIVSCGFGCYTDSATLNYTTTIADLNPTGAINPSGGGAGHGAVWVFFKEDSNLTYADWGSATITGAFTLTGHTPTCYNPGNVNLPAETPAGDAGCNFDVAGSSGVTIKFSATTAPVFSTTPPPPYPSPVTEVDIDKTNSPDPTPDASFTATVSTTITTVVVP
jgi:hypothetical protein